MNTKQNGSPPPASITLRDVYYVLFRHKWLIAVLLALGVGCSLAIYSLWPFPYSSRAKIFIRYIQDSGMPTGIDGSAKVKSVDDRGANILNTELEIMTSDDLAFVVASNLGPARILGKSRDGKNTNAAAGFISAHLQAGVEKNSDVIALQFSANDPTVVQPVLSAVIAAYMSKYKEVHLAPSYPDGELLRKVDESKNRLAEARGFLQAEKTNTLIISVDDANKNQANQIAKTTESVFQTKADLAENAATISDLQERIVGGVSNAPATGQSTNLAAAALPQPSSPDVVAKYQNLNATLSARRSREQELLGQLTTNNVLVQNAQRQRAAAEDNVKQFEADNPGLIALKASEVAGSGPSSPPTVDTRVLLRDAIAKQRALAAKYQELTNQLAQMHVETSALSVEEDKIMEAQNEKEIADAKYKHYQLALEQQGIDEAIGNKVSNIDTVEQPTPPSRDTSKILKATGGVLAFFLVLAFGLPFFIEMVLDQSLKHPLDVQSRIAAPYFITIPRTNGQGKVAGLKRAASAPLLSANGSEPSGPGTEDNSNPPPASGQVALWDGRHELRPFFETLRDRLMSYFEMINLTHKPKLVAVTSCGEGAGVTTTATGLASSLSETGEGNVLLVNMNVRNGEAHHYYKGKLACGIEEALEGKSRDQAQVHGNLYVANEARQDEGLPRVLPRRFSHLVPMMKASDYDYIIFDMPPVSEISITPRLARFMDMVLLVIESEKTPRDAAARAASLLADSKTNVGLVLNKNRSYVPKRLEQTL